MKLFIFGIVVGLLITIFAQMGWQWCKTSRTNDEAAIFKLGKVILEKSIKDATVLDVVLIPNYKEPVDYVYDKMYGLEVKYERYGKAKKIIFPLSKYKNAWISPNNTQLYILDNKAEVIYEPNKEKIKK